MPFKQHTWLGSLPQNPSEVSQARSHTGQVQPTPQHLPSEHPLKMLELRGATQNAPSGCNRSASFRCGGGCAPTIFCLSKGLTLTAESKLEDGWNDASLCSGSSFCWLSVNKLTVIKNKTKQEVASAHSQTATRRCPGQRRMRTRCCALL